MMTPRKTKTPQGGQAKGAFKTTNSASIFTYLCKASKARYEQVTIVVWRTSYALEDARNTHAALGHLWRQATCCVALALFRFIGGRHV